MIFVTVGSRSYPFDRLFKKLDELCEEEIINEEIFAQIGTSKYKPKHYDYKDFITQEEFIRRIREADIIISHGASGTIMKSLKENKKVIAVTRLKKYGEHMNDHQIQNNIAFSSNGYVLMTKLDLSDLGECIALINKDNTKLKKWNNQDPLSIHKIINQFIINNWS